MSRTAPAAKPPPLERGLPGIGCALQLWRRPVDFLVDAQSRHGEVFRMQVPGRRVFVISEPHGGRLLAERPECFGRRRLFRAFASEIGVDLFGARVDDLTALRKSIRLAYSAEVARQFLPRMLEEVDELGARLPTGRAFNVHEVLGELCYRAFGHIAADRRLTRGRRDAERFAAAVMRVILWQSPALVFAWPAYARARRRVHALLDSLLAEHEDPAAHFSDHLDMVEALRRNRGAAFTRREMRAALGYGLVGCLLYVRAALSSMLANVLADPSLHDEVRREGDLLHADTANDGSALRAMVVTRGVFMECLRLSPPVIGTPFVIQRDFDWEGVRFERGASLLISPVSSHHDPAHYRNPLVFDAHRFSPPRNEHRGKGVYSPFGVRAKAESRICAGQGLSTVLAVGLTGALVSRWNLRPTSPTRRPRLDLTPMLSPVTSFTLVFDGPRSPDQRLVDEPIEAREGVVESLHEEVADLLGEKLAAGEERRLQPGEIVFREGDPSDGLYVVLEGRCEVVRGEDVLATPGPGDTFGELGLLRRRPRSATVRVARDAPALIAFLDVATLEDTVEHTGLFTGELGAELHRRYLERNLLAAIPSVDPEALASVLPEFELVEVPGDRIVFHQGDPADAFYIVCKGRVRVLREHASGDVDELAQLRAGNYFGETGILQRQPRNATVRAATEGASLMRLERHAFARLVEGSEKGARHLAHVMHERILANFAREG